MPFDLATAKPVSSGFDLTTAKPVEESAMFPRVQSQAAPKGETGTFGQYVGQEAIKGVMDTPEFILKGLATASGPAAAIKAIKDSHRLFGTPDIAEIPNMADVVTNARKAYEEMIGVPNRQPADFAQRLVGAGARFAGASIVPSAATVLKAARPFSALSAEAMAALEGGALSSIGGDVGKDSEQRMGGDTGGQLGPAAGSLLGGGTGSFTGGATPIALEKLWSVIAPNVNKGKLGAAATGLAGKEVGGALNANPSSELNMGQAVATQDALAKLGAPGFSPTLAQASGAPAIASLEGNIARSTPEQLGKYAQNFTQNEGVIGKAIDNTFQSGSNLSRAADTTLRGASSRLDSLLAKIDETQAQVASGVRGSPQQDVGAKLQALRDEAKAVARGEKNARVADIYATAEQSGAKADMTDVLGAVTALKNADPNTFQKMPPVFSKVMSEYGGKEADAVGRSVPPDLMAVAGMTKKPEASFEELHSLYRETNSQLASAQRVGDMNAAYYLGHLKDVLKEKLGTFEQQGDELATKFKAFNEWFSTKYAPAFYEGVGGRMAASNRFGDVVKPESVVGKFFTPSGIDDFNLIYQGNKEAQQALKDGVLGLFRDAAIKDGKINPNAAQQFIRANQDTLAKVPDISATLKNTTAFNEALVAKATRLQEAQSGLDKTLLAKIAGESDNAKVIQKALADPVYLRQLVATARTPSAQKAVARGIVDGIPEAATKAGSNPLAFVLSNEATLRPALDRLDPKHFDNLLTIATARTIQGRVTPPLHGENLGVTDVIQNLTGSSPRTIWAQSANTAAGRQSSVTAVLHLLTRFAIKKTEERADDILKAVIYEPALAAEMAKAAKMPFSIGESNKLANHLINAGIRVTVEASQPSQQQ